jgi:hypothetical protein
MIPSLDEFDPSRLGRRDRAAPLMRRMPSVRSTRPALEGVPMIGFDHREQI